MRKKNGKLVFNKGFLTNLLQCISISISMDKEVLIRFEKNLKKEKNVWYESKNKLYQSL